VHDRERDQVDPSRVNGCQIQLATTGASVPNLDLTYI